METRPASYNNNLYRSSRRRSHFPGDDPNYTRQPIAESRRHFDVLKHSIAVALISASSRTGSDTPTLKRPSSTRSSPPASRVRAKVFMQLQSY
jgi:hypothetical protein